MTVGELIEKLHKCDPYSLVLVNGYEGGYDDPQVVKVEVAHKPDEETPWWGDYDDAHGKLDRGEFEQAEKQVAVVVSRYAEPEAEKQQAEGSD